MNTRSKDVAFLLCDNLGVTLYKYCNKLMLHNGIVMCACGIEMFEWLHLIIFINIEPKLCCACMPGDI
jgi:hypothetical protein